MLFFRCFQLNQQSIWRMFGTPTEETWPGVTILYANLHTYPKFKPTVPNSHFSNELFDYCLCACLCNWVAPVTNFYINVNSFLCFCLKISIFITVASCCSRAALAFALRCYYCFFLFKISISVNVASWCSRATWRATLAFALRC